MGSRAGTAAQRQQGGSGAAQRQGGALKVGQKVQARWGTQWLAATVVEVKPDGSVVIRYDEDGTEFPVKREDVRPLAAGRAAPGQGGQGQPGGAGRTAPSAPAPTTPAAPAPGRSRDVPPSPPPQRGPLTPVDEAAVKQIAPEPNAPWTYQPAAPAAPADVPGSEKPLVSVILPRGWDGGPDRREQTKPGEDTLAFFQKVTGLAAPSLDPGFVVTLHSSYVPGKLDFVRTRAQRVELPSGKRTWRVELPDVALLDVSPDGSRLLVRAGDVPTQRGRIDVYSVSPEGAAAHVVGFEPFGRRGRIQHDVQSARFVDNDHVLTSGEDARRRGRGREGRVVLWRIKDGVKALYETEAGGAIGGDWVPALDSSRKIMAVPRMDGAHLMEVMTGKALGRCPAEGAVGALTFRPDGRQLAGTDGFNRLSVWDLAAGGKRIHDIRRTHQGRIFTDFRWLRDGYLLVEAGDLLDLASGLVIFNYDTGVYGISGDRSPTGLQLTGGRVVMLVSGEATGDQPLAVMRLPHPAAEKHPRKVEADGTVRIRRALVRKAGLTHQEEEVRQPAKADAAPQRPPAPPIQGGKPDPAIPF